MNLTKIQEKTLKFYNKYKLKHKIKPLNSIIAKHFKISSGAVWTRLQQLKNKNLIK